MHVYTFFVRVHDVGIGLSQYVLYMTCACISSLFLEKGILIFFLYRNLLDVIFPVIVFDK